MKYEKLLSYLHTTTVSKIYNYKEKNNEKFNVHITKKLEPFVKGPFEILIITEKNVYPI